MGLGLGAVVVTDVVSAQVPPKDDEEEEQRAQREANLERTASGRVQRASAQVANFHLAEIANNEPSKDWPKRKFQSDLVPDDKKVRREGGGRRREEVVHLILLCCS